MTVTELIDRILSAYPGATPEAMATFKPVFQERFGRREGPHLEAAFHATLATFKPAYKQPFPIPLDLEQHMPSLHLAGGEAPIREMLAKRHDRARTLVNDWLAGQGAKIKAARAQPLYAACLLEVIALARASNVTVQAILLDPPHLARCYQIALSNERNRRHGRPERYSAAQWWGQIEDIAREWGLDVTPAWWGKDTAEALNPEMAKARSAA